METTLFKVRTTFTGADSASSFYFDTKDKAQKFLDEQENGEIVPVIITSDCGLNYWDGCVWTELTYIDGDADERDMTPQDRFKALRKRSGFTQKGFAERFNIPIRTIQNWEYGINEAPEYLLDLIETSVAEHKNSRRKPYLRLILHYKNETVLEQTAHYVHVEDGNLYFAKASNPTSAVVLPVKIPLENLETWDAEPVMLLPSEL